MFQMILAYVGGFGIEHMRIVFGPLSTTFCRLGTFIRVFSGSNILVLSLIIMGTRFMFVCVFRSIPMIDEIFFITDNQYHRQCFNLSWNVGQVLHRR